MSERCGDMEFSLYGIEGGALVEGVANFKYLVRPLEQTDYDWPEVISNIKRAQRVWGRLGKLIRREGADPKVEAILYRMSKQAVLLFFSETWVL